MPTKQFGYAGMRRIWLSEENYHSFNNFIYFGLCGVTRSDGFLRAAGVVCGVVIEKHFSEVCKNNSISISKKNPTIADYNDALKENVYDILEWRRIQRLGDIRNLCGHNKEREPTKEEVFELISGTERIIKTIF